MKHFISVIFVCLLCLSIPSMSAAKSSPPSAEGTWSVTGKATVSINISGLISIKANVLQNKEISDTFIFNSGTFSTEKLGPVGTYTVSKNGHVSVDLSNLVALLQNDINSSLPNGSTVTIPQHTCTLKLNSKSTRFTGITTFTLDVDTTLNSQQLAPVIHIVMDLSGAKVSNLATSEHESKDAVKVISDFIREKAINPVISRIKD